MLTTDASYQSSYQYIVGGSEGPIAEAQGSTTPPTNSTVQTSGSSSLTAVSFAAHCDDSSGHCFALLTSELYTSVKSLSFCRFVLVL